VSHDREFDLVLLGATGFTGRLTAEHLARRLEGRDTTWAIAGRNPDKLQDLADELPGDPGVVVADTGDLVGLLDLAKRTRVLGTTVGPYARHGELVVQACVRSGTHYADITGEPAFVDLLLDRYAADAERHGVKVVNCCGFDSVPHDLGVRFTVQHLPDDVPLTVRGYVRAKGRASGGTAFSALEAIAARATGRAGSPSGSEGRRAVALPARIHRVTQLNGYGVPLPTIDPLVVLRSARVLEGYGSAFRYGHYARVGSLPTVVAGVGAVGTAVAMASFGPTRRVLEALVPNPGEGPDEATRARSSFEVTFIGRGAGTTVTTRVAGGDPGYGETSRWLGEAMLSLADDDGPDTAGVLTPAVALGEPYHQRLVELGVVFEVVDHP
jgi:short subunit dehydrogenase-like uncharacterized protein